MGSCSLPIVIAVSAFRYLMIKDSMLLLKENGVTNLTTQEDLLVNALKRLKSICIWSKV